MNNTIIESLYRNHYKYLFMVAYNICCKWDVAEDIVQDGFIKILGSKEKFLNLSHGRRYLTGCIKNAAFERLGKEARVRAMRREFLRELPPIHSASLLAQVGASISKIKCAMSRTIIKEIYFYNRTRKEVGTIYEVSAWIIRNKERKALTQLSKLIIR